MAYYERKHPSIVEAAVEWSDEQRACVAAIQADLRGTDGNKYDDVLEHVLFRWARKHSFQPAAAANAFREYMAWRASAKVDDVLKQPVSKIEAINKILPYRYCGFDKEGRPVYIEKTGKLAVDAAVDSRILTLDEFMESHVWGMEHMSHLAFTRSLQTGRRCDTICSVIDLEGVGFHHRIAIPVLKAAMDFDSKFYPERLGKIYVINLPWIAPTMYQLIQPLLDDYTKSAIEVINDYTSVLPTVIEAAQLPREYGGAADNIAVNDSSDLVQQAEAEQEGLEKQYVSYEYEKIVECEGKSQFNWFFHSEGEYDIDFSVTAILNDNTKKIVKAVSRVVTAKGSWTSEGKCKVVFRWDNNFSYFYGKNLRLFAGVAPCIDIANIRDQDSSATLAEETAARHNSSSSSSSSK